jgi:O-antigen/teichoic acid export membrane protein
MLSKLATESAVGLYGVAYKVTFAFQFLPMAFAASIYPAMAQYHATDRDKLADLYRRAITYLFLAVAPLTVGIFALARPIIVLAYGKNYLGSIAPLQILIFSLVFAYLYWPAGSMLNACDRQARNTMAMGITMVSNILLNVFLIPRFGAVGAAAAAVVGNAVLFVSAFVFARKLAPMGYGRLLSAAVRITLAVTMMYGIVVTLRPLVPLLVTIGAGAVAYVVALFVFRALTKEELRALLSMVRRKQGMPSDITPS